jgi:hypothetical protein
VGWVGCANRTQGGGAELLNDSIHDTVQIPIDVGIPESQNAKPLLSKKSIAFGISPETIRQAVLSAIHLDHEALAEASKVNNVMSNRGLSPEVMSERL